jgi:hypothetical protein
MPDILNENGSCTDIKTITTRDGDEVEYSQTSISNNINTITSPLGGGKSFASMVSMQQTAIISAMQIPPTPYLITQSFGADSEPRYRYTVSSKYPYTVSVKVTETPLAWFEYFNSNDKHYVARIDAEKASLELIINYYKQQLHKFKVEASKFSRKKKVFSRYHQPNSFKFQKEKKMSDQAVVKLDNI